MPCQPFLRSPWAAQRRSEDISWYRWHGSAPAAVSAGPVGSSAPGASRGRSPALACGTRSVGSGSRGVGTRWAEEPGCLAPPDCGPWTHGNPSVGRPVLQIPALPFAPGSDRSRVPLGTATGHQALQQCTEQEHAWSQHTPLRSISSSW